MGTTNHSGDCQTPLSTCQHIPMPARPGRWRSLVKCGEWDGHLPWNAPRVLRLAIICRDGVARKVGGGSSRCFEPSQHCSRSASFSPPPCGLLSNVPKYDTTLCDHRLCDAHAPMGLHSKVARQATNPKVASRSRVTVRQISRATAVQNAIKAFKKTKKPLEVYAFECLTARNV